MAQRLLEETALPLGQVVGGCGFATRDSFTRVFHCALGMTPRVSRQAYAL